VLFFRNTHSPTVLEGPTDLPTGNDQAQAGVEEAQAQYSDQAIYQLDNTKQHIGPLTRCI